MRRVLLTTALLGLCGASMLAQESVITDPPGVSSFYEYSNVYFFNTGAGIGLYQGKNMAMEIVRDGNDVYLLDPVRGHLSRSFIKGEYVPEEKRVYFEFPQLIDDGEDGRYYVSYLVAKNEVGSDGRNKLTYVVPEGDNSIFLIEGSDGSLSTPSAGDTSVEYPRFLIGTINADGIWDGNGDANYMLTPTDLTVTRLPQGSTPEKWVVEYDNDGAMADVVFDGEDVYVGNFAYQSRFFLHGKLGTDNVARFEAPQFAGVTSTFFNYFTAIECEKVYEGNDWYYSFPTVENLSDDEDIPWLPQVDFTYDPDKREFSLLQPGKALMYNLGLDYFYPFVLMYDPVIRAIPENPVYGKPRTPELLMLDEYSDGSGRFLVDLPKFDVNGNMLDLDKTWYEVYFDDELKEFGNPEYRYIEEDMTRIPYTYSDSASWDLYTSGGLDHYIYFFVDVDKIAVRMLTEAPDGNTYYSDFAYWPSDLSSAPGILPDREEESPIYYDLMGRRIRPVPGQLVIKSTSEGTVKQVYQR